MKIQDNKTKTLADLILQIMEHTANEQTKRNINAYMIWSEIPSCSQFFNIIVANSNGYRTPIPKSTVHDAIDCAIRISNQNIDNYHSIPYDYKPYHKDMNKAWLTCCEQLMYIGHKQDGLLIEQ